MKKITLILFFLTNCGFSQNYADLLKINFAESFNNNFENSENTTNITNFEIDFTVPLVINEKHTFITGGIFNSTQLQLFPEADFSNLYTSLLKVGVTSRYSEKWSSTFVMLPKIASDFKNISSNDFFIGGLAIVKLHKNENFYYRFGAYGSQEAFGFFTTPIFGWYYLSANEKFEMNMSLPISADINSTKNNFTYGIDYYGIGRSFNLSEGTNPTYVDVAALEFTTYVQYNVFQKSVLLRAKLGYASNDFEVYNQGETIDLGLSAFTFGDNRTQLNPNVGGGLFFRIEALYRFNLKKKKDEIKNND